MIIVTGAAGFIGSCLVSLLNSEGYKDIVLVDDFSPIQKLPNLEGKIYSKKIHRDEFPEWLIKNHRFTQFIFHIGARTDTTEFDEKIFDELNLNYSKKLWNICVEYGLPFVYASSAATYGLGEYGYNDSHEIIDSLKPLNPYGESKNEFDKWV
jgi:ADP-L-glycero-D-manno-heptose 6-epimerase